jgi:phenylalanyl-tRNA synthetase beta subunit
MPWLSAYQSAAVSIRLGDREQLVGFAGRVEPLFLSKLDVLPESDAFVFEFDLDLLCALKKQPHQLVPLPRYQEVSFDLSFLVPLNVTTMDLEGSLRRAHKLVHAVSLLDFFEHERWPDQRAIAFSITIAHPEKTLEKEEIESARETLIRVATSKGAVLRA